MAHNEFKNLDVATDLDFCGIQNNKKGKKCLKIQQY